MTKDWHDKKESYEVLDGRGLAGDFLKTILEKAKKVRVGDGICVVQRFEPIPLYTTLEEIGFEHLTEKISNNEYRAYFYRAEEKEIATGMESPLHPAALANLGGREDLEQRIPGVFLPGRRERDRHCTRQLSPISVKLTKHLARPRRSSGNLSGRRKILP